MIYITGDTHGEFERVGNKVDVVITHCLPSSVQDIYSRAQFSHDRLTDYLDTIKDRCDFKRWFCGHYHDNCEIGRKFVILYGEKLCLADWLE